MAFVISMPICARTLRRCNVTMKSDVVVFLFLFWGGEGDFMGGAVLRGRHKGFFEEVGGGNDFV